MGSHVAFMAKRLLASSFGQFHDHTNSPGLIPMGNTPIAQRSATTLRAASGDLLLHKPPPESALVCWRGRLTAICLGVEPALSSARSCLAPIPVPRRLSSSASCSEGDRSLRLDSDSAATSRRLARLPSGVRPKRRSATSELFELAMMDSSSCAATELRSPNRRGG